MRTAGPVQESPVPESPIPESPVQESTGLYYTGLTLDRASARRTDPAWIAALLHRPGLRVVPLWRDQCLLRGGRPMEIAWLPAGAEAGAATEPVFLGLAGDAPVFAADLSGLELPDALRLTGADDAADLRALVGAVGREEAGLIAYARGILHWQRGQQFCGSCGGRCQPRDGGHVRACDACGALHFPRIAPAIIVLTELPGEPARCLLGRHQGAGADRFTTLAGFVEIGESLEDAVRREVAEEAGVTVGAVSYQASQAWPFPAGLMVAFRATATSPEIRVDGAELMDARWFTAAELRRRITDSSAFPPYRVDSIGRALIEDWLAEIS
jgi:NAD+ diphosphatase